MNEDEPNPIQLRFENGKLVKPSAEKVATDDEQITESIEPGDRTGFIVDVKSGAISVNHRLAETVKTHGSTLEFESRSHAEDYAHQLSSSSDGALRIQAAAQNDPSDVDAYLLADHNPSIREPAEIDGRTWTFDVGANLYGALGESILLNSPKPHALYYFVRQDLDLDNDELEKGLSIDIQSGTFVSFGDNPDDRKSWVPDCTVVATDGWNGPVLEQFYCEIKTGNASFERSQVAAMEQLAMDERVLKIRMLIEELPTRYSLRIQEVEPPG